MTGNENTFRKTESTLTLVALAKGDANASLEANGESHGVDPSVSPACARIEIFAWLMDDFAIT